MGIGRRAHTVYIYSMRIVPIVPSVAAGPTVEVFTDANIEKAYTTKVFAGVDHGVAI